MAARARWARLVLVGSLAAAGQAQGGTHLGAFGVTESTSCSGDCGSALEEQEPGYGASFLFTGRLYGDWGVFLELGGTDEAPFAGVGATRWFGPLRLQAGAYMATHQADYSFGAPFPDGESSEQVSALGAEVSYHGVFLRYQRYSADHSFESTNPADQTQTRTASASFDVDSFFLGYRYTLW
ncbi:MAG: hypothetical protein ACLFRB_04620 [Thiohalorhabdus sp.]|uniref:hypothetical protein n=1 Tax=Thiohalorhabdus sp. TaxID=3094134 RepID=UPI003981390E